MDLSRRRTNVMAGSVWESRIKVDEVKGGIKVFNGEELGEENGNSLRNTTGVVQLGNGGAGTSVKRKTWKSESFDGFDKNPLRMAKGRSENNCDEQCKELSVSVDGGIKRSPIQGRRLRSDNRSPIKTRKMRSEVAKEVTKYGEETRIESNSVDSRLAKPEPIKIEDHGSDEVCKEFGACEEKSISGSTSNPKVLVADDGDIDEDRIDEEEYEDVESEFEMKIMNEEKQIVVAEHKPKRVVHETKRFNQINTNGERVSVTLKSHSPVTKRCATFYQNFTKPTPVPASDEHYIFPAAQNKLQSLVDLVMWIDIPRSAFVFGVGTFIIISSSYTKDINISFISVMSYLGLVYLAAIFLYKSIICRGVIDVDGPSYVLGEGEAVWLLKLVLPYLNEFLVNLKAFFSGDPATTMKMAVLLFVLARCGSSITIWTMAKLGFFGVFTVPKVCSSYSTQLTAYGRFWISRFRDAWEACSHKKGVAAAIFTMVWNLSSSVARVWAVFMLVVTVRCYQQSLARAERTEDDDEDDDDKCQESTAGHEHGRRPRPAKVDLSKSKKGF